MSSSFGEQSAAGGQPASLPRQQASPSVVADMPASGWVQFAGIVILLNGAFNAFDGFIGFFRSTYYIGKPFGGDLWIWALLWLAFGVLEIAAGFAIMAGQSWARWFGIVIVGLNAMLNLFAIGVYPWWSITMIALDMVIIYGLTAGWRRTTIAA
jgi:hypothetical protein